MLLTPAERARMGAMRLTWLVSLLVFAVLWLRAEVDARRNYEVALYCRGTVQAELEAAEAKQTEWLALVGELLTKKGD